MLVAKGLLRHEKELEAWIATGKKSTDIYKQIVSEVIHIRQIHIQETNFLTLLDLFKAI